MIAFHSGPRYQRGRGLGSLFSGLFRSLKPLASMGLQAGKKFFQSDIVKNIGSKALQMGTEAAKNIAVDLLEGKSLKESTNNQINDAKMQLAQALKGSGRKRKRKQNKKKLNSCDMKMKRMYNLLD